MLFFAFVVRQSFLQSQLNKRSYPNIACYCHWSNNCHKFQNYTTVCVAPGDCCACSLYSGCSNKTCACYVDSNNNQLFGQSCLLTSTENTAVEKQIVSGADETLISRYSFSDVSFTVYEIYDLLKRDYTFTYKQLYAIYSLGISVSSNSVQQTQIEWFLRIVDLIIIQLAKITTIEVTTLQTFQIQLLDLIRSLMFKYISLDTTQKPYFYELGYFSAIIAKWKDTINYSNMKIYGKTVKSAQCEYKYKSVLIKYKFILAVPLEMLSSFTNSSFIFNSTVTYCQYMDKSGAIYYPPSSEYHYWHYVPNFDYEPLLKVESVKALGCFQISESNSVYSLVYDDQSCQYKGITETRLVPYCQCNSPGVTFVQILWTDEKMLQIALATTTQSNNTTESYGIKLLIVNLFLIILS